MHPVTDSASAILSGLTLRHQWMSAVKALRQRQRNPAWIDAETSVDVCCQSTKTAPAQFRVS
eukprot:11178033-Alexandrium_andersonii.AAC.1